MEKKLQKIHLAYYNLLIAQDSWEAHYQILSIIFLKEFMKLIVNLEMIIKYCNYFLQYKNFRDDLMENKCLCCKKDYQHKLDKKLKGQYFNKCKFSNHNNNNFILLLQKGV